MTKMAGMCRCGILIFHLSMSAFPTSLGPRFWDVQNGSVKVSGHDVKEFTCDSLLKKYEHGLSKRIFVL